ncbi:hypothetical protein ES703_84522 [subsurface metagenome]
MSFGNERAFIDFQEAKERKQNERREIAVGQSYTGDELLKLLGVDEDSFRGERFHIVVENKQMVVVAVDVGNDNWEVTHVFSKDKVFYSLCEDDILEVAAAEDAELTEEEMPQVKKGIESGLGNCWWDIVKSAIDDVIAERR